MKSVAIRPVTPTAARAPAGAADHRPPDPRWRVARRLTAPHRLGFFSAAQMLAISALWWAATLVARQAAWPLPWAVPPAVAHGLLMAMGFMPLFIVGFLFTAGPRWLGVPDVAATSLRTPVLAMLLGWALALVGCHAQALLAGLGVASVALGWTALLLRFAGLWRQSRAPDPRHAAAIRRTARLKRQHDDRWPLAQIHHRSITMAQSHAASGELINLQALGEALAQARTTALIKAAQLELIRLVLHAGKRLHWHSAPGEITVLCIEGQIELSTPTAVQRLTPGQLVHLRAGVEHALLAVVDAAALVTICLCKPDPQADQAEQAEQRPVAQPLSPG